MAEYASTCKVTYCVLQCKAPAAHVHGRPDLSSHAWLVTSAAADAGLSRSTECAQLLIHEHAPGGHLLASATCLQCVAPPRSLECLTAAVAAAPVETSPRHWAQLPPASLCQQLSEPLALLLWRPDIHRKARVVAETQLLGDCQWYQAALPSVAWLPHPW
jgi:hypothetical protein